MTNLTLSKTAYIAIDIQDGIVKNGELMPYSSSEILQASNQLAQAFKNTDALITLVNVDATTFNFLHPRRAPRSEILQLPEGFLSFSMPIASDETATNVIKVTKHNPSTFFGTDLDLQLRRRGIDTIILSGVVTTNGVYATALDAFQHGYQLYIVEDATSDRDANLHHLFFEQFYPKLGTVVTLEDILKKISK